MTFQVTLTTATGYVFNTAFPTIEEARAFMAQGSAVLLPGESLSLIVL